MEQLTGSLTAKTVNGHRLAKKKLKTLTLPYWFQLSLQNLLKILFYIPKVLLNFLTFYQAG